MNGGCLCGRVRYALNGELYDPVVCHCARCRKSVGAPYVAWASVSADRFSYTADHPVEYESSAGAYRTHCAHCGTSIGNHSEQNPEEMIINIMTLDDPEAVLPVRHIWADEKLSWVATGEGLPLCKGPG